MLIMYNFFNGQDGCSYSLLKHKGSGPEEKLGQRTRQSNEVRIDKFLKW